MTHDLETPVGRFVWNHLRDHVDCPEDFYVRCDGRSHPRLFTLKRIREVINEWYGMTYTKKQLIKALAPYCRWRHPSDGKKYLCWKDEVLGPAAIDVARQSPGARLDLPTVTRYGYELSDECRFLKVPPRTIYEEDSELI